MRPPEHTPLVLPPFHRGGAGEPLVLLHGFTGAWPVWRRVLPALEAHHDVLAPTLPGHAGGPPLEEPASSRSVVDQVEALLDAAGIGTAHLVGNSLGGYLALRLAERGRARSVVALSPAGGWVEEQPAGTLDELLAQFSAWQASARAALPHLDRVVASPRTRRGVLEWMVEDWAGVPEVAVAEQLVATAGCSGLEPMATLAREEGYAVDPERVTCPVRFVWGERDRLLPWPAAAARYRRDFWHADWVELPGVGHCPQLEVPAETAQLVLGLTT